MFSATKEFNKANIDIFKKRIDDKTHYGWQYRDDVEEIKDFFYQLINDISENFEEAPEYYKAFFQKMFKEQDGKYFLPLTFKKPLTKEQKEKGENEVAVRFSIPLDKDNYYIDYLYNLTKLHINIFYSTGCYKNPLGKKDALKIVPFVYVDIDDMPEGLDFSDNEKLYQSFKSVTNLTNKECPDYIVKSGHGIHLYYENENTCVNFEKLGKSSYKGDGSEKGIEDIQRRIITFLNGDTNCEDVGRQLRLPCSFNCKGEPVKGEMFQNPDSTKYENRFDFFLNDPNYEQKLKDFQYQVFSNNYLKKGFVWNEELQCFTDGETFKVPFWNAEKFKYSNDTEKVKELKKVLKVKTKIPEEIKEAVKNIKKTTKKSRYKTIVKEIEVDGLYDITRHKKISYVNEKSDKKYGERDKDKIQMKIDGMFSHSSVLYPVKFLFDLLATEYDDLIDEMTEYKDRQYMRSTSKLFKKISNFYFYKIINPGDVFINKTKALLPSSYYYVGEDLLKENFKTALFDADAKKAVRLIEKYDYNQAYDFRKKVMITHVPLLETLERYAVMRFGVPKGFRYTFADTVIKVCKQAGIKKQDVWKYLHYLINIDKTDDVFPEIKDNLNKLYKYSPMSDVWVNYTKVIRKLQFTWIDILASDEMLMLIQKETYKRTSDKRTWATFCKKIEKTEKINKIVDATMDKKITETASLLGVSEKTAYVYRQNRKKELQEYQDMLDRNEILFQYERKFNEISSKNLNKVNDFQNVNQIDGMGKRNLHNKRYERRKQVAKLAEEGMSIRHLSWEFDVSERTINSDLNAIQVEKACLKDNYNAIEGPKIEIDFNKRMIELILGKFCKIKDDILYCNKLAFEAQLLQYFNNKFMENGSDDVVRELSKQTIENYLYMNELQNNYVFHNVNVVFLHTQSKMDVEKTVKNEKNNYISLFKTYYSTFYGNKLTTLNVVINLSAFYPEEMEFNEKETITFNRFNEVYFKDGKVDIEHLLKDDLDKLNNEKIDKSTQKRLDKLFYTSIDPKKKGKKWLKITKKRIKDYFKVSNRKTVIDLANIKQKTNVFINRITASKTLFVDRIKVWLRKEYKDFRDYFSFKGLGEIMKYIAEEEKKNHRSFIFGFY